MTWSRKNLADVETLAPAASVYLTPERLELQATARRFAMEEVLPVADELDPQRGEIPDELLARLAELDYFGIMIDREHGGLGLGVLEYALICEELARGWMSVASIIARGNGTGCAGRPDLLARSARGEWIGGIAFSEPSAGSDLANVGCSAERDGDEWVISGTKRWVGHAKRADFLHLLARTREPREGHGRSDGLELFLVEKARGSFPDGVSGTPIDKIGYYGLTTWELTLDGLRVPVDALQDTGQDEGQGFKESLRWLGPARVQTAARAVGLARGAVEDAIAYVKQRVQFGHPIGDQQVIRHALADLASEAEAARQLYLHAAWLVDSGVAADVETSQAKLVASETAERVTSQALQIFGGNGYTTEYSAERYWRDARLTTIFEGTSEIQRKIVSDALLAD
ncbi:acyl-CoA dehydrogenase family protein [Actinomycetospora termitidis]|uniref:Acyl-CoA dehydrogenase family protein n=1 Tax=Actinomycetospora termitidis TaxID=3053470 RepID=A0ABT7MCX4_9PSEU|nr:acyl-CoA dehydrogenase family protein [Actinomycetospora sp. Odt1-22]MDL5158525.1 acyl-CoA dehydrogenase family protein [Actinomycetospora sp. Odt1-22]